MEAKIETHLIRSRCFMNQFNIELDWKFTLSLTPSWIIMDRFQTNNTLIYSHGRSYNVACSLIKRLFWFKVQILSIA